MSVSSWHYNPLTLVVVPAGLFAVSAAQELTLQQLQLLVSTANQQQRNRLKEYVLHVSLAPHLSLQIAVFSFISFLRMLLVGEVVISFPFYTLIFLLNQAWLTSKLQAQGYRDY